MIRVIGVGDNVIDRYRHRGVMYPGGNSLNFAVYAKKLGHQAAYMGVIADDRYAEVITRPLRELRIDYSHCEFVHGATGLSTTTIENGDRTITDDNDYGAVKATPLHLTEDRLNYIATFDLAHSSCFSFIEDQLHRITERGVPLVYDFSDEWNERDFDALCPAIGIAFFSGKKLPIPELKRLLERAVHLGCGLAVTTIGKQGALVFNGRKFYQSAPYNLDAAVVDTLGAGDSFLTGFLTTYMEGRKRFAASAGGGDPSAHTSADDRDRYDDALMEYAMQAGNLLAINNCMFYGAFGYGVGL
ncbi:MAG: PfkB family carbohydrate kinase [Planctomycetaceae bacterium]|nr:PfkB family carbohydrate kinase [Planctomycetaceae bacterium]